MGTFITHIPENSSHVEEFTYDPAKQQLHVRFRKKSDKQAKPRTYIHAGVPPKVFEAMRNWPSAGQYYHSVIKRHYKLV